LVNRNDSEVLDRARKEISKKEVPRRRIQKRNVFDAAEFIRIWTKGTRLRKAVYEKPE